SQRTRSGGFALGRRDRNEANSTALAIEAERAMGRDDARAARVLRGLQRRDGAFQFTADDAGSRVIASTESVVALSGHLAPVARAAAGDPDGAAVAVRVAVPSDDEVAKLKSGQILVGFLAPLTRPELKDALRSAGVQALAMESIPRISRAQSMDALSSQANVGGYKAALLGAEHSTRFYPMLMTAAGTIPPAKVLVLGVGVAGLQALATARRLGA